MSVQSYQEFLLNNLTTEHGVELTNDEIENVRNYLEENFAIFKQQKKTAKTNKNSEKTKCECLVWNSTECKMTGGMKYAPKNPCQHFACPESLEDKDSPNLCKRCFKKYQYTDFTKLSI